MSNFRFHLSLVLAAVACGSCAAASRSGSAGSDNTQEPSVVSLAGSEPSAPATEPASEEPSAAVPPRTSNGDVCKLKVKSDWEACEGQQVMVEGAMARMVMQHPMVAVPGLLNDEAQHQSYVDVPEGPQLIVVTAQPVSCSGAVRVSGTLESVKGGGRPGTKDSYSGWAVKRALVECR